MEKQLNNSFTTGLEAGAELNENFSFREGMNATIPKLREVGLKNPIPLKVLSPYPPCYWKFFKTILICIRVKFDNLLTQLI